MSSQPEEVTKVFSMASEEEEAMHISDALSAAGVTELEQDKLRLLQQQLAQSGNLDTIESLDPDEWFNIPVPLVKAVKAIVEQFRFQDERLTNFMTFHKEHLRFQELSVKGLQGFVAKSNTRLKGISISKDNSVINKETQSMIESTKHLIEVQVRVYMMST